MHSIISALQCMAKARAHNKSMRTPDNAQHLRDACGVNFVCAGIFGVCKHFYLPGIFAAGARWFTQQLHLVRTFGCAYYYFFFVQIKRTE